MFELLNAHFNYVVLESVADKPLYSRIDIAFQFYWISAVPSFDMSFWFIMIFVSTQHALKTY